MKTHTIFLQYQQEVRRFSCSTAKAEPFDSLSTIRLLPQFVVHPIMEFKIFRLTYSEAVTSFIKEAAKRPVIICQILALQFQLALFLSSKMMFSVATGLSWRKLTLCLKSELFVGICILAINNPTCGMTCTTESSKNLTALSWDQYTHLMQGQ